MLGNRSSGRYEANRGGTRGGQSYFKWEDVKSEKERENYLGHSLHAPVGRWQKGKDLQWWSKGKGDSDLQREEEIRSAQAADDDAINEALGLASGTSRHRGETKLEAHEMKQLLAKGESAERDEGDAERVTGLGVGGAKYHDHVEKATPERRKELAREAERQRELARHGEASVGHRDAPPENETEAERIRRMEQEWAEEGGFTGQRPHTGSDDAQSRVKREKKAKKAKKDKRSKKDKKDKRKKEKKRRHDDGGDARESKRRRRYDSDDEGD